MTPHAPTSATSLANLREEAASCRACHLWKDATQTVFGEGPQRARLMLVGRVSPAAPDRVRAESILFRQFKLIWVVQSCQQKYFAMPVGQIIDTSSPRSVPAQRGVARRHERWDAECDGRGTSTDERCCARTAKSCGPDTPRQVSSWRGCFASRRRRRQQSQVSGESTKETVKPLRRECR
jgi:hypothetical protein